MRRVLWVALAAAACVGIGGALLLHPLGETSPQAPPPQAPQPSAGKQAGAAASSAAATSEEVPTRPEAPAKPSGLSVPKGMVYVPGGRTLIGVTEKEWAAVFRSRKPGARRPWGREAQPPFAVEVESFLLDRHPVTVAAFRQFVEQAGYRTQAERFGNAGVFDPDARRWRLVEGTDWRRPLGPGGPKAKKHHPVTQVSWNDATAYCQWKERRLPTEVEWEHAARGARNRRTACPWGRCRRANGEQHQANTWQGRFPARNTADDGYRYTSPVGVFGEVELELTDMGGNVWEWTSSVFRPYSERVEKSNSPAGERERVQRGGSFQCNECGGFHVFARSHSTPETSLFHVGFRCAKNLPDTLRH